MAAEHIQSKIPFEASLVEGVGLLPNQMDFAGLTDHFTNTLHVRPEVVQIGLLGLNELDEYYEGGFPEDARDALFTYYLHKQRIPMDVIAGSIYGRYDRDQFAHVSQTIAEINRVSNSWVAKDRDRFMYMVGQADTGFIQGRETVVANCENRLRNGENITSAQEYLNTSRATREDDDARVVRSKLVVEAQMQPTADTKLTALARLGLSDAGIFRRLAVVTGNFRNVSEADLGTYALQLQAAMHMLAEGEQVEVIKGTTGLSDTDFVALTEYLTDEKPEIAASVSHELVEMAKQGVPLSEWYIKLRKQNINSKKILDNPVFASRVVKNIVQRLRDGVEIVVLKREGILPIYILESLKADQAEYRAQKYEELIAEANEGSSNICEVYKSLRDHGFRMVDILSDSRILIPLQNHVISLQNAGVTWSQIMEQTGVTEKALHLISKQSIKTGKKQNNGVGVGGMTKDEVAAMDAKVLACIRSGITTYQAIADKLNILPWRAHRATVRLLKSKRISSGRKKEAEATTQLRDDLLSCGEKDIDRLWELMPRVTGNFTKFNPSLFTRIGNIAKDAGIQYQGRANEVLSLVRRSELPFRTIEYPVTSKGKRVIARMHFVPNQVVERMKQYFQEHDV